MCGYTTEVYGLLEMQSDRSSQVVSVVRGVSRGVSFKIKVVQASMCIKGRDYVECLSEWIYKLCQSPLELWRDLAGKSTVHMTPRYKLTNGHLCLNGVA